MTVDLFDLTYRVAAEMGILQEGVCTGGSTNTILDTVNLTQADDYWNSGTVWITYDAGGAGGAPQGEYSIVSDSSSTKVTVTTGWSTATAVGDHYAIAKGGRTGFQLYQIVGAINRAVRDVGYVLVENSTALDTAASKTEYALPAAANEDLREVYIQTVTNDTNDNRWVKARNWHVDRTDAGTGDTLVFQEQPAYARDILLKYMAPHADLVTSTDYLSEQINPERVVYKAAYYALAAHRFRTRDMDDYLLAQIDELKERAERADIRYPVRSPKRTSRIMSAGWVADYDPAPGESQIT